MPIASTEQRITAICLLILTALALAGALFLLSPVLLPFVLAILLTYCLAPIIDLLIRFVRMPRSVAIITTMLLACVVLFIAGLFVSAAVSEVRSHIDDYEDDIEELLQRVANSPLLQQLGLDLAGAVGQPATGAAAGPDAGLASNPDAGLVSNPDAGLASRPDGGLAASSAAAPIVEPLVDLGDIRDQIEQALTSPETADSDSATKAKLLGSTLTAISASATRFFRATVSGIMSILSNGTLVLIFTIFMLAGRAQKAEPGSVLYEIRTRTKRYLLTMLFISGITGVLVGTTLYFLGIPFAWMFGFLAFLLNFIPNLGSVIATLLPVPVIILTPDLPVTVRVLAIAVPAAIQFGVGNLLQPKIMGQSLDLHPVTILMALIFFGVVWGIVGMFLATPLVAIVKILLDRFDYTRPVADVLAGRLGRLSTEPVRAPPAGAG